MHVVDLNAITFSTMLMACGGLQGHYFYHNAYGMWWIARPLLLPQYLRHVVDCKAITFTTMLMACGGLQGHYLYHNT